MRKALTLGSLLVCASLWGAISRPIPWNSQLPLEVDGVALGMTESQVRSVLGAPTLEGEVERRSGHIISRYRFSRGVRVELVDGRVQAVSGHLLTQRSKVLADGWTFEGQICNALGPYRVAHSRCGRGRFLHFAAPELEVYVGGFGVGVHSYTLGTRNWTGIFETDDEGAR